ncbi:hypothetical protein [Microbacterium sp.]|uniref:hypothetical protein n=1 Tax=Microbacterium sp. TaxID=51671 RepID=UPI0035626427
MPTPSAERTRRPRPVLQRPLLPLWLAVLAAAASGFLMNLAYPGASVWPFAFVGVALLLLALIGRRAGGALLVGLIYGAVFFFLLVSWTSRYLGVIPWAALASLEAVITAVAVIPIALAYRGGFPAPFPGQWGASWAFPRPTEHCGWVASSCWAPGRIPAFHGRGSG